MSFINIDKREPLKYPAKFNDAKIPANVISKWFVSILGISEVKANLATPSPIMIANIPAIMMLKLSFLSNNLFMSKPILINFKYHITNSYLVSNNQ